MLPRTPYKPYTNMKEPKKIKMILNVSKCLFTEDGLHRILSLKHMTWFQKNANDKDKNKSDVK